MDNMNIERLLKDAKAALPGILGELLDRRGLALLRTVFTRIRRDLERIEEGIVAIECLGTFYLEMTEVEDQGTKRLVKRILFVPAGTEEGGVGKPLVRKQ